jgi:lipoyl-dependent peroxiredoxin subunit D
MEFLSSIKARVPDYAKDIRLNLDGTIARSSLEGNDAVGVALAAAFAAKSTVIVDAIRNAGVLSPEETNGALTAAALMGMNNVYYRFRHLIGREVYSEKPARLRMNRIARPAASKLDFELFCLAVSAINGCESCLKAHEKVVLAGGLSEDQVHDAVRIAAVINGAAVALDLVPAEAAGPADSAA